MRYRKSIFHSERDLNETLDAAQGRKPCDVVIRGAQVLDVWGGGWIHGDIAITNGRVVGLGEGYKGTREIDGTGQWAVPGFIDAHVHLESSMMTPPRFAEAVMPHGTTSVVWDPHEIANVRGAAGIQWALDASENCALDVFVMVPSCVPATSPALGFETSGAVLEAADIRPFRDHPRVLGLAEFMNFPGLLSGMPETNAKLLAFQSRPVDGHCPGITGMALNGYAASGVSSDHESTTYEEAVEKIARGIHVFIREGSCAKDADTLLRCLTPWTSGCVAFCTDDRNPLDIEREGHVNVIVDKALRRGIDPVAVFRAASFAPANVFGLRDRGVLAPGYWADICLVTPAKGADWTSGVRVRSVMKRGVEITASSLADKVRLAQSADAASVRNVNIPEMSDRDFRVEARVPAGTAAVNVIVVRPGQIITDATEASLAVVAGEVREDIAGDVLKLAVIERHHGTKGMAVGFVKGFGIKSGAIATTINHDSHNVIVVGTSDALMAKAVNRLREINGGIVVMREGGRSTELALEIGGLMTSRSPSEVSEHLRALRAATHSVGCPLEEPFLQLSFLALPVIPSLKLTDKGLVDVSRFRLVHLFV